jgi:NADPH:quinone reductase-like Zn-dependent oxidoreductase
VKAVRFYEYGGPENLKYEDNVPEPALSDDSVLVETSATSVNPIGPDVNDPVGRGELVAFRTG